MSKKISVMQFIALLLLFCFSFYSLAIYLPQSAFAYHDPPADQGHSPNTSPGGPGTTNPSPNPNQDAGGDPVQMRTGNYIFTQEDFVIPGRGIPIYINRVYNVQDMYNGPFGHGWNFDYNMKLMAVTDSNGGQNVIIRERIKH